MWLVKLFGGKPEGGRPRISPTGVSEPAMPETLAAETKGDLSDVDIFEGCNTLVHLGDGTIIKFDSPRVVDVANVAARLLNAQFDSRICTRSPVELRYHQHQPDLKIYALRNRVGYGTNKTLQSHHGILEKGPVVVFRLSDNAHKKKSMISTGYESLTLTKPVAIKARNQMTGSLSP